MLRASLASETQSQKWDCVRRYDFIHLPNCQFCQPVKPEKSKAQPQFLHSTTNVILSHCATLSLRHFFLAPFHPRGKLAHRSFTLFLSDFLSDQTMKPTVKGHRQCD